MDIESAGGLDAALVAWMDCQYLDGEPASQGASLMAAVAHARPEFSPVVGDLSLPTARRALRGWKRLCPPRGRTGLPMVLVALIAHHMAEHGHWREAVFVMMAAGTYWRPIEGLALRAKHLIPPMPEAGPGFQRWSVILNAFAGENSRPSKTGEYDETLVLDVGPCSLLGGALARLRQGLGPEDRLFPFDHRHMAQLFQRTTSALGVPFHCVLYMLRHSGASDDFLTKRRTLEEIKKRGRWRSDSSLRRYEKGGMLAAVLQQLAPSLRQRGAECLRRIHVTLSEPSPLPLAALSG